MDSNNDPDILKIVKIGEHDTPSSLAQQCYGDASKFQIILDCNDFPREKWKEKWKVGIEIKIPRLPVPLEEVPVTENSRLVTRDVANLEGRKLLRENIDKLYGVSGLAVDVLKKLKITSIFDLAMSHYFNSALRLVDPATPLEAAFIQHGFVPGDTVQSDPSQLKVSVLADDDILILHFENASTAKELKEALHIQTIRDMALWPPFQNARQILLSTFDPMELTRRGQDPEAPSDLVPACGNFPTECVYYTSVFMDEIDPQDGTLIDLRTSKGVSLFGSNETQGFTKPAKGGILTYKQSWYAQGVTLGQLLHSLALAPGESTRIAMVDWYRRTGEKASEEIAESDVLSQTSQQARSISEITNAVATEMQHGSTQTSAYSRSKQYGASGGMGLIFQASGGGSSTYSIATSVSSSSGQRNMAAEMNQRILSSTQQNATAERSRRATIVRETYQEEKETLTTRVVANYNHMHALTVQYYEVVQVYRVRTELLKAERVLFIPMEPINFGSPRVFARYKELLKNVAVNEEIRNKLDAWRSSYADLTLASENVKRIYHSKKPSIESIEYTSTIEVAKITIFKSEKTNGALHTYEKELENQPKEGKLMGLKIAIDEMGEIDFKFKDIGANGRTTLDPKPECSITYKFMDNTGQISKVQDAFCPHFDTIYPPTNEQRSGTENETHEDIKPQKFTFPSVTVMDVNYVPPLEGDDTSDLIQHLSDNRHYSHAIWLNLDSLTLSQMLAGYKYGEDAKSLASQVDPQPVAITGNYLGFRWPAGNDEELVVDSKKITWQQKMINDTNQSKQEAEIPLPSGGVFAEAVLGRFNSAEKLDITRYWNWQDSPIPLSAPEIAALTAGGKSQASTLTPGQLGQSAVTINTLPSLPEPTGMKDIMQAMAVSNMFRDMSGQAATVALAGQGMQTAEKGASNATQQASENMRTYIKMVGDVAKEVLPMVATGGLSGASISKAGAVANLAGKIDEKKGTSTDGDGTGNQQSVLKSLIGVTKGTETEIEPGEAETEK